MCLKTGGIVHWHAGVYMRICIIVLLFWKIIDMESGTSRLVL